MLRLRSTTITHIIPFLLLLCACAPVRLCAACQTDGRTKATPRRPTG